MMTWELRESSSGEVRTYHSIMEQPSAIESLTYSNSFEQDYAEDERRARLEELQRTRKWQVLVFGCAVFIAIACVVLGRGF